MGTRIHIGNISQRLHDNKESFEARIAKYGTITKPLELFSKPIGDHYFGFVTMDIEPARFEQLKKSLNGVLYMGMKLSVDRAKPDYAERSALDNSRPDALKSERLNRERIARARDERIKDANTRYQQNSVTGEIVPRNTVSSTNASLGYRLSAHTHNNASGNTKNSAPTTDLVGPKSYSTDTTPKRAFFNTAGAGEVIRGRMRKTPRPAAHFIKRQQTMRILVNGELRTFKSYKTKLWGIEKNKTVKDLTWKYDGVWRSGDNHVVERVTRCGISGRQAAEYGKDIESTEAEDPEFSDDLRKNQSVLAGLLDKYDFDKPMELDDANDGDDEVITDHKGRRTVIRYDYEGEGGEVQDDVHHYDEHKAEEIINRNAENLVRPTEEVYYDEDDEGNELDMDAIGRAYTTEALNERYKDEHRDETKEENEKQEDKEEEKEDNSDHDTEFVPTFGSLNNTETLRSLFNPETQTGFKLALSDEDEDVEVEDNEEEQKQLLAQIQQKLREDHLRLQSHKYGLFWSHFESPFLQTQTQLSKVGAVGEAIKLPEIEVTSGRDNTGYEEWFYSVRGEVTAECKKKRKDAVRLMRKKMKTGV